MKYVIHTVVTAVALAVAAWLVHGIIVGAYTLPGHVISNSKLEKGVTLVVVAVIVGLVNAIIKPVIKTLGCGLYVLTLGLVAIIVNGLLLWLVSYIAGDLNLPFHITGFVPAVEGALIVGIVSWGLNLVLGDDR
jgi:putative membrane protein